MSKSPKSKKSAKAIAPAIAVDTKPQTSNTMPSADEINQRLALIGTEVRNAFDNFDFVTAKNLLEKEVMPYASQHPVALNDLAFAEKNLGNHQVAYNIAMTALNFASEQHLPEIYDNLASICHKLARFEESKYFGRLAIFVKKESVKTITPNALPKRKKKGLHADKTKNIIAFSLTGENPRQCETAVLNASLATNFYPNWTCRFYVDNSVPAHVIDRLTQYNVQIFKADESPLPPVLRHFAVMADTNVHAFLLRDVDSMLSRKEAVAVDAWLDSKQTFHIMRDFYDQSELVLASMWGGYTGSFDNIEKEIVDYFTENGLGYNTILQFLRTKIYPTLAQSLISHDDLHLDPDSYAYPSYVVTDVERTPLFHIGMPDGFVRVTSINLDEPAKLIEWFLVTEQDDIICYYTTPTQITDGKHVVSLNLPYFYSQNIEKGLWSIRYQVVEA